jgi:hypothetical protein
MPEMIRRVPQGHWLYTRQQLSHTTGEQHKSHAMLTGDISHPPAQMVRHQRWTQSLENLNFSNDLK